MPSKQEQTILNLSKFIKSQTLILLDKLNELDNDELCELVEDLHDDSEYVYERIQDTLDNR